MTTSALSARTAPAWLPALAGIGGLCAVWALAVGAAPAGVLPGPLAVARAIGELAGSGALAKHLVASLFRVTWGYLPAVALAVPVGIWLGRRRHAEMAVAPLLELLRPVSPLAWIPFAILFLGVGDLAAIAIIFVASFLPLALTVRNGVHRIPPVYLQAGRNFGLGGRELVRAVILPALLPDLVLGLRLALGIAWLVVVAAEMLAVNSGLGFLIVDARNAGNRYDLVVAGMVLIGTTGLLLDLGVRRLERLPALRWGSTAAERRRPGAPGPRDRWLGWGR
jgi:NitT/TauT family transport system permease protein